MGIEKNGIDVHSECDANEEEKTKTEAHAPSVVSVGWKKKEKKETNGKKCTFHPIQSDGNTMFHRIRHTSTTTTEPALSVLFTMRTKNKTKMGIYSKRRKKKKNDAEQIVRQRIQLLRKGSKPHRNRFYLCTDNVLRLQRRDSTEIYIYVTRSRSKFCETTTTLSVEGYDSRVFEVFGCVTRGCQHQANTVWLPSP